MGLYLFYVTSKDRVEAQGGSYRDTFLAQSKENCLTAQPPPNPRAWHCAGL